MKAISIIIIIAILLLLISLNYIHEVVDNGMGVGLFVVLTIAGIIFFYIIVKGGLD
jgi:hypothetical protein